MWVLCNPVIHVRIERAPTTGFVTQLRRRLMGFPIRDFGTRILSDGMTSSLALDERRRAEGINDMTVRQKRTLKLSVLMRCRCYFSLQVKDIRLLRYGGGKKRSKNL